MENVKHMKEVMDFFIKSLPDFLNKAKNAGSFSISSKDTIVFKGTIDHVIMREWCKLASKNFIPFKFGTIIDYDNDIYKAWEKRNGYIYVTVKYVSYISSDPLELSWGFMEIKDGE